MTSLTWHWHENDQARWLTCDLLAPWPHGFFTRRGSSEPADCAEHLGLATAHRLKQIHSAEIFSPQPELTEGDALVHDQGEALLCVASADCVPILVASDGLVAAIHAGWRGTAQQILPKVLARFQAQGVDLRTVRIGIGPAISPAHYPVGPEVAQAVLSTVGITEPAPTLDLKHINALQALGCGVPAAQIQRSPHCTFEQAEWFYSYRRDGRSGVQWSGIALPSPAPLDKANPPKP